MEGIKNEKHLNRSPLQLRPFRACRRLRCQSLSPCVSLRISLVCRLLQSPRVPGHCSYELLFMRNGFLPLPSLGQLQKTLILGPSTLPSVPCESSLYMSLLSTPYNSAACSWCLSAPHRPLEGRAGFRPGLFLLGSILPALSPDDTSIWETYSMTQSLHGFTDSSLN